MENENIFQKASKMAEVITNEEIQLDLLVLQAFFKINNSKGLIESIRTSKNGTEYNISEGFLPFISFLKEQYNDECKCLAVFMKVLENTYEINLSNPESKLFYDLATNIFHHKFQEIKDVKLPSFFDISDLKDC